MGFFKKKKPAKELLPTNAAEAAPPKKARKAKASRNAKPKAGRAIITPAVEGWQVYQETGGPGVWQAEPLESLDAVAARVGSLPDVQLLLPMRAALTHQLVVPTDDPEEAASMAELQAEKVLPFAHQDCPLEISVLERQEESCLVGLCAASPTALEKLLSPLLEQQRWPEFLGLHIEALARQCPPDEAIVLLDVEDGDIVMGLARYGALVSAEVLAGADDEPLGIDDIDRVLWELRMMRLPAEFTSVRVGPGLSGWCDSLREHLDVPVEVVGLRLSWPVPTGDLMPHSWRRRWQTAQTNRARQRWLGMAGLVYLALLVLAGGYLYWMHWQLGSLRAEAATKIEEASQVSAMRAEWETWAPAVDPNLFAVELLSRIVSGVDGGDDLTLTRVHYDNGVLRVDGEASSLQLATIATDRIEQQLQAGGYNVSHPPPSLLPNDRAKFNITARR